MGKAQAETAMSPDVLDWLGAELKVVKTDGKVVKVDATRRNKIRAPLGQAVRVRQHRLVASRPCRASRA